MAHNGGPSMTCVAWSRPVGSLPEPLSEPLSATLSGSLSESLSESLSGSLSVSLSEPLSEPLSGSECVDLVHPRPSHTPNFCLHTAFASLTC